MLLNNKLKQDTVNTNSHTPFLHLDCNNLLDTAMGIWNQLHSTHLQHIHHQLGILYRGNLLYFQRLYTVEQLYSNFKRNSTFNHIVQKYKDLQ